MSLAKRLYNYLSTKQHENGSPISKIYGSGWKNEKELGKTQGDIVNFNFLRDDGSFVGFVEARLFLHFQSLLIFRLRRCVICSALS
jgi:hypothetical protein